MFTGSFGGGVFGGNGLNVGSFANAGALLGAGAYGPRHPDPPELRDRENGVVGLSAGVGAGVFGTNAKNVCQLKGPFKTLVISAGVLFGGEVQISWSHGIYMVSVNATVSPLPFPSGMVALMPTETMPARDDCGCK